MSCLMHLDGYIRNKQAAIRVMHIADVLTKRMGVISAGKISALFIADLGTERCSVRRNEDAGIAEAGYINYFSAFIFV